MYNEIVKDINERIKAQPNSLCATADEVRICWLVAEVDALRKKIQAAENCLVCASIANPMEIVNNTYKILQEK